MLHVGLDNFIPCLPAGAVLGFPDVSHCQQIVQVMGELEAAHGTAPPSQPVTMPELPRRLQAMATKSVPAFQDKSIPQRHPLETNGTLFTDQVVIIITVNGHDLIGFPNLNSLPGFARVLCEVQCHNHLG